MEPDVQVYTRSDCGPLWLQPCLPFSDIVGWFETHRGCIYFIQFTWTFDNLMNLRPPYNYSANYSANVNRNLSPDSEFWPGWPIIRWPFVHDLVWPSVTLPVWPSIIWDLIEDSTNTIILNCAISAPFAWRGVWRVTSDCLFRPTCRLSVLYLLLRVLCWCYYLWEIVSWKWIAGGVAEHFL